jgi:hypothetical protein
MGGVAVSLRPMVSTSSEHYHLNRSRQRHKAQPKSSSSQNDVSLMPPTAIPSIGVRRERENEISGSLLNLEELTAYK